MMHSARLLNLVNTFLFSFGVFVCKILTSLMFYGKEVTLDYICSCLCSLRMTAWHCMSSLSCMYLASVSLLIFVTFVLPHNDIENALRFCQGYLLLCVKSAKKNLQLFIYIIDIIIFCSYLIS